MRWECEQLCVRLGWMVPPPRRPRQAAGRRPADRRCASGPRQRAPRRPLLHSRPRSAVGQQPTKRGGASSPRQRALRQLPPDSLPRPAVGRQPKERRSGIGPRQRALSQPPTEVSCRAAARSAPQGVEVVRARELGILSRTLLFCAAERAGPVGPLVHDARLTSKKARPPVAAALKRSPPARLTDAAGNA